MCRNGTRWRDVCSEIIGEEVNDFFGSLFLAMKLRPGWVCWTFEALDQTGRKTQTNSSTPVFPRRNGETTQHFYICGEFRIWQGNLQQIGEEVKLNDTSNVSIWMFWHYFCKFGAIPQMELFWMNLESRVDAGSRSERSWRSQRVSCCGSLQVDPCRLPQPKNCSAKKCSLWRCASGRSCCRHFSHDRSPAVFSCVSTIKHFMCVCEVYDYGMMIVVIYKHQRDGEHVWRREQQRLFLENPTHCCFIILFTWCAVTTGRIRIL